MPNLTNASKTPKTYYRPEQTLCPVCHSVLKRDHILWHKQVSFSTGTKMLVSWAYRCPQESCPGSKNDFRSQKAEAIHLKYRRFSRELVVRIGFRHFWQHQTMYEVHDWLAQDLHLAICPREVANLLGDFLALLSAAQPAKIRHKFNPLKGLILGIDGMQPEKGNGCLYIVRELQCGVTLLAVSLEESSQDALRERIFEPLKDLAMEFGLAWHGIVSDAQETIQLAVAQSLPGVPHQACQSHCLRDAGKLTFEADRAMKTDLKASFRHALPRLRRRIQALPVEDPFRTVLLEYARVLRSLLLEGGVAPFELGGIRIYDALEDLQASVVRCQKKALTSCYAA